MKLNFITSVLCSFLIFLCTEWYPLMLYFWWHFQSWFLHFLLWCITFYTLMTFPILVLHFLRLDDILFLGVVFFTLTTFLCWCCIFYLSDIFYLDFVLSILIAFSILNLHFLLWCIAFSTFMTFLTLMLHFFMHWWHFLPLWKKCSMKCGV